MSTFNIFRNATIRNAMSCRHDNNDGYAVVWDKDEDFKQYGEFSGLTTRLVWDRNYFAVSTSGVAYIGPTVDQPPVDGGVYDIVKVVFRIELGEVTAAPTTGRIQFQTANDPVYDSVKVVDFPIQADNSYNEYRIDMSSNQDWQGDITRLRLYPFIDGSPGLTVHFKSIRVQSSNVFACDTIYNGSICSKYSEYSHPCPWVGAGGSCSSGLPKDKVDVVEGVTDRLLVNINGYGEQAVVLAPAKNAKLEDVARDLEDKLSNIGIGGYAGNRVEVNNGIITIIADDTREDSSSVVVSDTPAARELGFFSSSGSSIQVCKPGVEAASRYDPAGTRSLSRSEMSYFYFSETKNDQTGVLFDPRRFAVQAGRADYANVHKTVKIDSYKKSIIEFNNPVTNNGTISDFSFSGDATVNTKFLFFRPFADGSLKLIKSVPLSPSAGSLADKVFSATMSVKVRKGDLVGLYDARIDAGRSEHNPNVSYFLYDGLLNEGDVIGVPELKGRGESGLRLFAHGQDRETEAVVEFSFPRPELVEEIEVVALESTRTEEINLTRSRGGGIGGGPVVSSEVGVDKLGSPAPPFTDLAAITDGVKHDTPGALIAHPSWLDSFFSPSDLYDQTEFSITLDFAKGVPVFFNIERVVIYFRDTNNVKYFSIEYPLTTNSFDTLRYWGAVSPVYSRVLLDGKLLEPAEHPIYKNPIQVDVRNYEDGDQ